MARQHNPLQQWKEAKQIASDYNMFIVEKGDAYLLYRKTPRPVYIGKRGSVEGIRTLVEKCAGSTTASTTEKPGNAH